MTTKKLYYENAYLMNFDAKVISCEPYKDGFIVELDQTAFYPEGGGQPADMGLLNDAHVSYVYIREEVVYHVVDRSFEIGEEVKGKVDFERRFDLMQQHSGEHILSGLIHQKFGYNNVGFHLNTSYMTADFDGELTKEELEEVERKANEAIYENIPITGIFYNQEDIRERAYRSKIDIIGQVRLVEVRGYDTCACCGIHVKYTGEIGSIKCINSERHRGGTRITMLCGKRALADYSMKQDIVAEACTKLSAKPEVVIEAISRVQEEVASCKGQIAMLTNELFAYKVKKYVDTEESVIYSYEAGLTGDALRRLCIMLTENTTKPVLVLTGEQDQLKYALGVSEGNISALGKKLNENFSGKGGGNSALCQGSLVGNKEQVESFFRIHAI